MYFKEIVDMNKSIHIAIEHAHLGILNLMPIGTENVCYLVALLLLNFKVVSLYHCVVMLAF